VRIYRGCHQWFRYGLFNMSKYLMPREIIAQALSMDEEKEMKNNQ
jgi:hypothetical protein